MAKAAFKLCETASLGILLGIPLIVSLMPRLRRLEQTLQIFPALHLSVARKVCAGLFKCFNSVRARCTNVVRFRWQGWNIAAKLAYPAILESIGETPDFNQLHFLREWSTDELDTDRCLAQLLVE